MYPIQPGTRTYLAWAEAFTIFAKYRIDEYAEISAEHDVIYAGPSPDVVVNDDLERLEVLGWHADKQQDCFLHYT